MAPSFVRIRALSTDVGTNLRAILWPDFGPLPRRPPRSSSGGRPEELTPKSFSRERERERQAWRHPRRNWQRHTETALAAFDKVRCAALASSARPAFAQCGAPRLSEEACRARKARAWRATVGSGASPVASAGPAHKDASWTQSGLSAASHRRPVASGDQSADTCTRSVVGGR